MKHKSLFAVVAAITLAMSSMTAFAGELPTGSDNVIEGDVNYVNTTVYQVTLPTTAGMEFALDPQGLTSLDEGAYDDSAAGKIVAEGTMTAVNESSVDLKLTSSFYVEDSTGTLTLVGADDAIDDTKQQIKLVIQADVSGGDFADVATVTSTDSTAKTDYVATMGAAEYTFSVSDGDYAYTKSGDGTELNMQISGLVAKDYDWSAYGAATNPATIKLHAVFKFENPAAQPAKPENAAPSIASNAFNYSAANGATISVDLGNGNLAATGISSVKWASSASGTYSAINGYSTIDFNSSTGILTLPSGLFGGASVGDTRAIKITFNDTAKTSVILTMTKTN